ncbi:DUF452 family protein [bacterium]|nr:DUF452 family protein [bacterium]
MQYHWLNKKNNSNLIIFFCGWSFDYKPFERLACNDNDVLVVYDYGDIGTDNEDIIKSFSDYKSFTLITWSMGVYIAYLLKNTLPNFDKKIAINGTPYPVHDEWGIPVKTFDLTLKYVDTGLQGKFQKNLFKRPEDFEKYLETPVERTIENQKTELIVLDNFIRNRVINYERFYDYAIISDTDKIIPTRNQKSCWENFETPYKVLNSGHFPFYEFNSWEEILNADRP